MNEIVDARQLTSAQEYWREAAQLALEEVGIELTSKQADDVGVALALSSEMESTVFGPPAGPSPDVIEARRLRDELTHEREKVTCPRCDGQGRITCPGPYHSSTSRCLKCNGEGRVHPKQL